MFQYHYSGVYTWAYIIKQSQQFIMKQNYLINMKI